MKKTLIFALVIVSLLAVSCKSTPKTPEEVTDEVFTKIYARYEKGLILEGAKSYTVKSGDTLAHISHEFYGSGFYYPVIMLASSSVVKDLDKIRPGMVLTIPDLEVNKSNSSAKRSIRGVMMDCADIDDVRSRHETANGLRALADTFK